MASKMHSMVLTRSQAKTLRQMEHTESSCMHLSDDALVEEVGIYCLFVRYNFGLNHIGELAYDKLLAFRLFMTQLKIFRIWNRLSLCRQPSHLWTLE